MEDGGDEQRRHNEFRERSFHFHIDCGGLENLMEHHAENLKCFLSASEHSAREHALRTSIHRYHGTASNAIGPSSYVANQLLACRLRFTTVPAGVLRTCVREFIFRQDGPGPAQPLFRLQEGCLQPRKGRNPEPGSRANTESASEKAVEHGGCAFVDLLDPVGPKVQKLWALKRVGKAERNPHFFRSALISAN